MPVQTRRIRVVAGKRTNLATQRDRVASPVAPLARITFPGRRIRERSIVERRLPHEEPNRLAAFDASLA